MQLDILIDKLTPCLFETATGKILQTTFSLAKPEELIMKKSEGWNFDWVDKGLVRANVYKLQLKDDDEIQGLVAAEVVRGAVYIHIAESAPHNLGQNKRYEGVGGHLIAIAIKLSIVNGFGGYVFFNAKNQKLVEHYTREFGATHLRTRIHEYRMEIDEESAQQLIEKYTLEGDLDVR